MPSLIINIDVPDLDKGIHFYTSALDLHVSRRFEEGFVELLGAETPIYLLEKKASSTTGPNPKIRRTYDRHWTPLHLDFAVSDLAAATARAIAASAIQEGETAETAFGRIAMFADPFGHGFDLIQFNEAGYDALARTHG